MAPWKKIAAVGGGALLLLLVASSDSSAANQQPDVPPPPPPKPPQPGPGPHPPPWDPSVAQTHTVRVPGGFSGMRVRMGPSTGAAIMASEPFVANGQKIGVLEEVGTDTEGAWAHVYTPHGFEGWLRSVDPKGNRNIWYDAVPDAAQQGPIAGPADGIDLVLPQEAAMFAKISGFPRAARPMPARPYRPGISWR